MNLIGKCNTCKHLQALSETASYCSQILPAISLVNVFTRVNIDRPAEFGCIFYEEKRNETV